MRSHSEVESLRKGFEKYHRVKTKYKDELYDSKAEALFAELLDSFTTAEDPRERVTSIHRQARIELLPKPNRVTYIADFMVNFADGSTVFYDVKGFETPEFKLKHKMFKHFCPELKLEIVHWSKKRFATWRPNSGMPTA